MNKDFHNYYQPRTAEQTAAFDSEFGSVRLIPANSRNIQTLDARQDIESIEKETPSLTMADAADVMPAPPVKPAHIIDIAARTSPFGNFMAKAEASGLPNPYRMPIPPAYVPRKKSGSIMNRLQTRSNQLTERARRFGSFVMNSMSQKSTAIGSHVSLQREPEYSNRPFIAPVTPTKPQVFAELPVARVANEVEPRGFRKRRVAIVAGGLVLVTVLGGAGAKLAFGNDSPLEHSPRPVAATQPVAHTINTAPRVVVPRAHAALHAPRAHVQLAEVRAIHMAPGSTVWGESKAALMRAGDARPSLAAINQKTIETLRLSYISPAQTTRLQVGTILQIRA
jgi:hypothetical protein